jgi:hypothetical protein
MPRTYIQQNLQKASFKNEDLTNANFAHSDLRGADFSGANLTGADFTDVKIGIRPMVTVVLFIAAFVISAFSGYVAMLAGNSVQRMLGSPEGTVRAAGIVSVVATLLFIIYSYIKGVGTGIRHIIIPTAALVIAVGIVPYLAGWSSGEGMLYLVISLSLVVVMFIVGTLARAVAGTMSSILFLIVALSGGLFAKSVGGGIGTALMAISCAMISKRALSGAKGFELLRKMISYITAKFGTSFRHAELANANFSHLNVHNADFTDADVARANWFDSKKINCVDNTIDDDKRKGSHGRRGE